MMKRDAYLEHLAKVPMFRACSKKELTAIGRQAEDVFFEAGQVIVKEGSIGTEFYVIAEGRADVTRKRRKVAELGPGDFFGELGLLARLARDATVTARTPIEVLVIGRPQFMTVLQDVPTVTRKLLTGMALRLHELDQRS